MNQLYLNPAVPKPLSPTDVLELTVHSAVCSSNLDNFLKYIFSQKNDFPYHK